MLQEIKKHTMMEPTALGAALGESVSAGEWT